MLGGFPIRDLDFTVESTMAPKIAKTLAKKTGARIAEEDEHGKSVELVFAGGARAEIAMARQQQYPKPGGRPQVTPATIHEDLRYRDFTVNAIALSLNRASRGLLIDPTNGLGDLERKELRTAYSFALYDDPSRILRLIRLRVRLGFTVEERTQQQYENVRSEKLEEKISPARLLEEIRRIAEDPNPADVLQALAEAKLLHLFSPSLAGAKLNLAGFAKLHKAKQLVPAGIRFPVDDFGLFLNVLTEKLTPRGEIGTRPCSGNAASGHRGLAEARTRSKKLEKDLKSPKLTRPSQLYHVVSGAPGDRCSSCCCARSTD